MTEFVFVTSDSYLTNGEVVSARIVASNRINYGYWPLGPRTPNRRAIAKNDSGLIYLSGNGEDRGLVVYVVKVTSITDGKPMEIFEADHGMLISSYLEVELVKEVSINLKNLLIKSGVVSPTNKKWGAILTGGVRKLKGIELSSMIENDDTNSTTN